jgi:hypothetical protein
MRETNLEHFLASTRMCVCEELVIGSALFHAFAHK